MKLLKKKEVESFERELGDLLHKYGLHGIAADETFEMGYTLRVFTLKGSQFLGRVVFNNNGYGGERGNRRMVEIK